MVVTTIAADKYDSCNSLPLAIGRCVGTSSHFS